MGEESDVNDVVKDLIGEVRKMNQRLLALESENNSLRKAVQDPSMLMRKHGWMSFTTPHADETYDQLNRTVEDMESTTGPFSGSGGMISKSRDDEIKEWQQAERMLNNR